MILMISPGMFWLSAQQAPPRRKLCPDKLPSPWVTAFSFLSNTAPDMGKAGAFGDWWTAARSAWQTRGKGGEGGGLVVWPWFLVPGIGWSWTTGHRLSTNSRHWAQKSPWWSACPHQTCFANRLALRNRPKNLTRHAAQKTMSSLSPIFNTFLIRNVWRDRALVLFTAVPLTLSIHFKVEEMNQLPFNGLLKPASRCMTLTMFNAARMLVEVVSLNRQHT